MSTTYHFVKVEAGEPFEFDGHVNAYHEPDINRNPIRMPVFKGQALVVDIFILRPVEPSADGGREVMLSLLSDLVKGEHSDSSCSLEAQGYNQSECELIGEKDYWAQRAKTVLRDFTDRPAAGQPAPVDNVALLEWVGVERWQLLNAVYRVTGTAVWYNSKTNRKVNTAALIQEFINQQTKEV